MSKYLPICGKNSSNNATPIGATNNGELKVIHVWETTQKKIVGSESIRDTSAHVYPPDGTARIDVSDYAITSLRIVSSLDQPATIRFLQDNTAVTTQAGGWLADKNGSAFVFVIPTGNTTIIITPEDFPPLNYLRGLRVRIKCDTAPTTGYISIYALCKR